MSGSVARDRRGDRTLSPELCDLHVFLDLIPDALVAIDGRRERLISCNDRFLALTGSDPQEVLSREKFADWFHPEDRHRFHALGSVGRPGEESALLRLMTVRGPIDTVVHGGYCVSEEGEERWCYRISQLDPEAEGGVRRRFDEQKRRASEAVRTSLQIFHLTEKIRAAPRLSARLLGARDELELLERAGRFLLSEGLDYRDVCIHLREDGIFRKAWCSCQEECNCPQEMTGPDVERCDTTDGQRRVLRLQGGSGCTGLLQLSLDPAEQRLLAQTPLFRDWHDEVLGTIAEVIALFHENFQLYRKLEEQALLDPLTLVNNRHFLVTQLENEVKTSRRNGSSLSLIFIDMDGFKEINDTHGHLVGDRLLKEVSEILVENFRETDHVCRYGGDEFIVLLPATDLEGASQKGSFLLESLRKKRFCLEEVKGGVAVSMSVGVTTLREESDSATLINEADEALYRAKRAGRNRLVVVGEK
ncbi:MAG TPA: sensor domain-containing diguanylate cyclase [Planctomycetes bacterium]|nr:sensor domain-containing diguanylate cyclase [Planctomycetota bacterium]HIN80891.1 sensor domain-containing diguanylate cyclase [Planctomycetota bacterium]